MITIRTFYLVVAVRQHTFIAEEVYSQRQPTEGPLDREGVMYHRS